MTAAPSPGLWMITMSTTPCCSSKDTWHTQERASGTGRGGAGRLSQGRPCAGLTGTGQGRPRQTGPGHAAGIRARWARDGPAGRAHGAFAPHACATRPALLSASWAPTQPHANHGGRRICDPRFASEETEAQGG